MEKVEKVMKSKTMSKVIRKRPQGTTNPADVYTIETKGGKTFCFTISEDCVLIHNSTTLKDVTFVVEGLDARIHSYNIDATIYQIDSH
jgi:hypothetical protein